MGNTGDRTVKNCTKGTVLRLYNNRYMIASTQITNTEICTLISALVLKLLSRKVLFTNRKIP